MSILRHIPHETVLSLAGQVSVQPGQIVSKTIVQNDAVSLTLFALSLIHISPAAQRALKKSVPLSADRRKLIGHLMNHSLKTGFDSVCLVVPRIRWTSCRWIEPGTGAFSRL